MCLNAEKEFKYAHIGYRIAYRDNEGRLFPFMEGKQLTMPKDVWLNEADYAKDYAPSMLCYEKLAPIYKRYKKYRKVKPFTYPRGWHIAISLKELKEMFPPIKKRTWRCFTRVAFKEVLKTGEQYNGRVVVARYIKILDIIEMEE